MAPSGTGQDSGRVPMTSAKSAWHTMVSGAASRSARV